MNDSIRNIVKRMKLRRLSEATINYRELDHEDLIKLTQAGDQRAFEELVDQYNPIIDKYVRNTFLSTGQGDEDDVRQIALQAFWEAVKSYNSSVHKNGFGEYAKMIIGRKIADELRKDSAEKRKLNIDADSMDTPIASDGEGGDLTIGDTISDRRSAEDDFMSQESVSELIRFMENNLSDTELSVIKKYIAGHKVSEIAEETGMKYKTVENAIMRVKNKLAEYIKKSYSEKKDLKEEVDIEFSDEEKQLLSTVISKLEHRKGVREAAVIQLKESYENYTETQLDREMDNIEDKIESIVESLKSVYSDREELFEDIDNIRIKLSAMDCYLTESQIEKSKKLRTDISKAEEDVAKKPVVYMGSDYY